MENLIEEITDKISDYFISYTNDADIPQRATDTIDELVASIMVDISDILENTRNDVDDIIYEFSEENLKDIKADIKYQDEKEADLWT